MKLQKKTKLEEIVLDIFKSAKVPLTVPQILTQLKSQDLSPNKTTIYRQIQKLVDQNHITAIVLTQNIAYYEYKSHHHHHIYCTQCTKAICIEEAQLEVQIHKLEEKMKADHWSMLRHEFSFSGICPDCRAID